MSTAAIILDPLPVLTPATPFADNLRSHRSRLGLTQAGLARAVGAERVSVARWESGAILPRSFNVRRLCDLFRVTERELMDPAPPAPPVSPAPEAPDVHRLAFQALAVACGPVHAWLVARADAEDAKGRLSDGAEFRRMADLLGVGMEGMAL